MSGDDIDAGTGSIADRFAAMFNNGWARPPMPPEVSGPGVSVSAGIDVQLGRLCGLLERQELDRQQLAQAIGPIDLPPVDYTITGGQPKFKVARATANDASPQEGYLWFVTRLSLAGMTAGDVVNLYMPTGVAFGVNATALHTFQCPAGVGAGLGIADWEPGITGCVMHPDDGFVLASAGTLTATELILTGQAIQVMAPYVSRFLL